MDDRDRWTDIILQFLEVALHEFLYVWKVYPEDAFELRSMYRLPVHMCRHPQLSDYLFSILIGCRQWIQTGHLKCLSVHLLSHGNTVLRVMHFESNWIHSSSQSKEDDQILVHLEDEFRATLIAIAATAHSCPLDDTEGSVHTFRVLAETAENNEPKIDIQNIKSAWILADSFLQKQVESNEKREIVPVRSIGSASIPLRMELYMESSKC
uniref:Uncharacterized protein AlNc14C13G1508 n=1 Tax=Albugo laibachii Nc14 TaxID=890382 RepID=F0W3D1_9STRA|nr:conserved hypothetical protein [Albugo laibachii Nc14]|eukprot:CCA15574.1 conserved hypothetical protein [Albugo laibachii Nc14]